MVKGSIEGIVNKFQERFIYNPFIEGNRVREIISAHMNKDIF